MNVIRLNHIPIWGKTILMLRKRQSDHIHQSQEHKQGSNTNKMLNTWTWSKIVKHISKRFHLSRQNDEITTISQKPISQNWIFMNKKATYTQDERRWREDTWKWRTLSRRAGGREALGRKWTRNPSRIWLEDDRSREKTERQRRRTDQQRTLIEREDGVRQTWSHRERWRTDWEDGATETTECPR